MSLEYETKGVFVSMITSLTADGDVFLDASAKVTRHLAGTGDIDVPLLICNIPRRTHRSISMEGDDCLSRHPNICGFKSFVNDLSWAIDCW